MKYIGSGKQLPILTGLNSGVWKRVSSKAKEDVESVAKELLQIYALREISKCQKIISSEKELDEYWEFVNEFEFSDTEDQYINKKISLDLKKVSLWIDFWLEMLALVNRNSNESCFCCC